MHISKKKSNFAAQNWKIVLILYMKRKDFTWLVFLLFAISTTSFGRTFSSLDKNNCQVADSAQQTVTIVMACDKAHFNLPVDSVRQVYVCGSVSEWNNKNKDYVLDSLSEDSCFYHSFTYDQLARPGNSGQPEFVFYVELTNDSALYLCPDTLGEAGIDRRLIFINNDTVVLLVFDGGADYFTTNLDTLYARCLQAQKVRPLADYNLLDSVDQHRICNFRLTPGTTCLYRSYHPYYPDKPQYDTERQRLYWVAELATQAGVRSDISLSSDQQDKAGIGVPFGNDSIVVTIPAYHQQILDAGNILFVGKKYGATPTTGPCYYHSDGEWFARWFEEVVTFINDTTHPLPIQIHCALGADRTGMFCATLAALCGVDWSTIMADYAATGDMQLQTYRHPNRLRYAFQRMTGLNPDSVSAEQLSAAVRKHFVDMSVLRETQIDSLVSRLQSPYTPICPIQQLPRIYLQFDVLDKDTFNAGYFTYIDDQDTLELTMKIRHRGSSSAKYTKQSYAIKLQDQKGKKYETSFLGMRKDNYWIMDAMAVDKARMRNRASMDLWLEMAHQPWYIDQEPKLVNGYRGKMVEAYVNNLPCGVYCLMERIDRKQLKLAKYEEEQPVSSTLYKSIRAERSGFQSKPLYKPSSQTKLWDYQWEPKLPDYEDGEPIVWDPLYNMFNFIWKASTELFIDSIDAYIDLPVWIDYELLCQLLFAWDNTSKNLYISFYDLPNHHLGLVTLWDMDHSWGRQWNGKPEVYDEMLFDENQLSQRLRNEYPDYVNMQEYRWAELRKTSFSLEHLDSLLGYYFALYHATGLDRTERLLWSTVNKISFDIEQEQEFIHEWLEQRLAYLDEYFHMTKPTSFDQQSNCYESRKIFHNGQLLIKKGNNYYDYLGRPLIKRQR